MGMIKMGSRFIRIKLISEHAVRQNRAFCEKWNPVHVRISSLLLTMPMNARCLRCKAVVNIHNHVIALANLQNNFCVDTMIQEEPNIINIWQSQHQDSLASKMPARNKEDAIQMRADKGLTEQDGK